MWKKKLCVFLNNNSGLIAFITALASLATALSTFSSVKEMRDARNQLYEPCIIFERSVHTNKYKDYERFTYEHDHNFVLTMFDNDDDENTYVPNLAISGYNIGEGVATDLCITFKFDNYNEYVEKFSEEYPDVGIELKDYGFDYHSYYDKQRIRFVHRKSEKGIEYKKQYLRPDDKMIFNLPEEYCKFLYLIAGCKIDEEFVFSPSVDFHIEYYDIQGILYENDYKVSVNINVERLSEVEHSDEGITNMEVSNADLEDHLYNVTYELESIVAE